MSRPARAGAAGRNVTIRATDSERGSWSRQSDAEGCDSLSAWIVKTLNRRSGHYGLAITTLSPPARSSSSRKTRSRR